MQSVISYGIEIWGGAYNIHLNKVKIIMNKIIKYILRLPNYTNTDYLYKEINVLSFDRLLNKCTLLLAFKHKKYFTNCNHNYNTRLKKNINIIAPICHKHFGTKSCLNRAITLCRNLEININNYPNFIHFKRYVLSIV